MAQSAGESVNPYAASAEPTGDAAHFTVSASPPLMNLANAIPCEGVLSYRDVLRAYAIHTPSKRWIWTLVALAYLFVLGSRVLVNPADWHTMATPILCLTMFVGLLTYLSVRRRAALRNLHRNQKGVFVHHTRWVGLEGVKTATETSVLTQTWGHFSKYKATDRVVLLYVDPPTMFQVFSRELFDSQEAWNRFLGMVDAHVSPASARFRTSSVR